MEINLNNYEEYLLSYLDGELDDAAKAGLEEFLEAHPELREELELLRAARLEPEEDLVFRDKSVLYRDEKAAQTIPPYRRWWAVAAAAAALAILVFNRLHAPEPVRPRAVAVAPVSNATDTLIKAPADKHRAAPVRAIPQDLALGGNKPGKSDEAVHPALPVRKKNMPVHQPQTVTTTGNALAAISPAAPVATPSKKEKVQPALVADSSRNSGALAAAQPPAGEKTPAANSRLRPEKDSQSPAPARPPASGSALTVQTTQPPAGQNTLAAEAGKLASAKQELDEKITGKISGAQDFVAEKFRSLRKKGIRIGRLEIVMN